MTDERALKLARKVAKPYLIRIVAPMKLDEAHLDAGGYDDTNAVQIALAAIKLTTQLAAEMAVKHAQHRKSAQTDALKRRQRQEARDHESMAIEAMHISGNLRAFNHLPNDGGENV
ncbi:hypothetical protein BSL82_03610 [Tardibacter chloracetimidivorans]|uniref:Uncharacterized protein n=2 Tax=Tardibacter chloracetimidivorans TaxID=1921510 RepID=A0A1L3ZSA4_9SPHN|nr:hypothetical protein BSL82_03610 [Tardibacter chloracetimidivorans]